MTLQEKLERLKEHYKLHNPRSVYMLFIEKYRDDDDSCVIFNMTNEDTDTTFSLKKLYMCYLDDPTEVDFVDNVFNGRYDWLEALKKNNQYRDFYYNMRIEAEQRRIAKNIKEITALARGDDPKNKLAALKYLTDNSFNTAEAVVKRGRPSKEEREGAMKLALKEMTEDEQDLAKLLQ